MDWGWIAAGCLVVFGVAGALVRLGLQTWIKARIETSVKARVDKELEGYRSEIRLRESEITALQSTLLTGRAGRQALLDKRRIEAIEKVWCAVIKLNAFHFPAAMLVTLNMDEVDKDLSPGNENLKRFFETLSGGEGLDERLKELGGDEEQRLYIPEEVWKTFAAYKGLLLYCYMRLKSASFGVGGKYLKDSHSIDEIKNVLPHFSDYLDKWGISGAAHLAQNLRDLVFKGLKAAIANDDSDVVNLIAAREMVKLTKEYDQKLTE